MSDDEKEEFERLVGRLNEEHAKLLQNVDGVMNATTQSVGAPITNAEYGNLYPQEILDLMRGRIQCVEQANVAAEELNHWLTRLAGKMAAAREKAAARGRGEYAG